MQIFWADIFWGRYFFCVLIYFWCRYFLVLIFFLCAYIFSVCRFFWQIFLSRRYFWCRYGDSKYFLNLWTFTKHIFLFKFERFFYVFFFKFRLATQIAEEQSKLYHKCKMCARNIFRHIFFAQKMEASRIADHYLSNNYNSVVSLNISCCCGNHWRFHFHHL